MTLHAAIEKLLKFKGKPMSIQEIADELNAKGWYQRKNGTKIQAVHIHGRTRNYKDTFIRKGSIVSLFGELNNEMPKPIASVKTPTTSTKKPASKPGKAIASAKIPSAKLVKTTSLEKTPFIKPVKTTKGKK